MLADSHVLCRTSPVFRKMLRGPFAERKPGQGNWNIKLPEDDSGSFAVLMDMAHGLFCLAQEETTVDRLYGLCVLTDKYDMVSVLRPMQGRWFKKIEASISSFALHNRLHRKMMFIAFELGYSVTLKGWILNLMQKCPTDMNGNFIDKNDVPLMHYKNLATPHMSNILGRCRTMASWTTDVNSPANFSKSMLKSRAGNSWLIIKRVVVILPPGPLTVAHSGLRPSVPVAAVVGGARILPLQLG